MAFTKYTLISNSGNYGAVRASSAIKYLVYHYTGNKTDTALNNANYFKNNIRQASAHYFVDDTTVYQSVPDLTTAWAVGDRKYSDCSVTGGGAMYGKITNTNSISIEMCSVNGAISDATIANAVALGKEIMAKYNIPISNVYRHFDVSGKHCPGWSGWYGNDSSKWTAFKNSLLGMTASTTTSNSSTNTSSTSTATASASAGSSTASELYRVRKTWEDSASQLGAFYSLAYAKAACINGYSVFDSKGNVVYTNPSNTASASSASGSLSNNPTAALNPSSAPKNLDVNVYYRVYAGGRWYSEVKNLEDYAGDGKNAIRGIAVRVDNGSVKYRIHVKGGGWYPYVTGYDTNDFYNGYAGDCMKDIDMVEIYYNTPSGYAYRKAKYRVAPIGRDYYSWQYDNEKTNGCDGYAGSSGVSFGKFQIVIE